MTRTPDGPVVIITGALSGIGEATAIAFAAFGARLVLCDQSVDKQQLTLDRVQQAGGHATVEQVDVRNPSALREVATRAVATYQRIDALVVCAGIADQSTVAGGDPTRWQAVIETNLLGTMYSTRAVLPIMQDQQQGDIFLVASVSGREAYVGEPAYIASKWGQVGFAHALRQEVMDRGIRVTLIEPGLVDSPLTRNNPKLQTMLQIAEPLTPVDVAATIAYAFSQPAHVLVSEITVRPLRQPALDLREA